MQATDVQTRDGLEETLRPLGPWPSPEVDPPVAVLESEGGAHAVSPEDLRTRRQMAQELRRLPREALSHLRHFQAQIGCLNRCAFCSQSAGTTLWELSREALANLIAAIKTVALEHICREGRVPEAPLNAEGVFSGSFVMPPSGLIASDRNDRPGVVYCYLDNDPSSYGHLDSLIEWLHTDLGVKTRVATVGYSRRNPALQRMHERISADLSHMMGGLRLSFSPYTYGWTRAAAASGKASRQDFEADIANFLSTYRRAFLNNREGRKGACVELRFKPLVVAAPLETAEILGCAVIRCGPYLVVSAAPDGFPPVARLSDPHSHELRLSEPGSPAWLLHASSEDLAALWREIAEAVILRGAAGAPEGGAIRMTRLHVLENEDGVYFAADAVRDGATARPKYFYPKTAGRRSAGYVDGERYFLNALTALRPTGRPALWKDAEAVMNRLHAQAEELHTHDPRAAAYLREQVAALVESYVSALRLAGYPASAFFDRDVTVDTGHICNLGRAYSEYKAIASRPDLPLTPNHERAFGASGELAQEGVAWRLSVAPVMSDRPSVGARGGRNGYQATPSILIEELDLAMTATSQGQSRRKSFIPTTGISTLTLRDNDHAPLIPGHTT